MQSLRALIGNHRNFALALIALAFCVKAVVPAGFMVSASKDTFLTVTICSGSFGELTSIQLAIPGKDHSSGHSDGAAKKGEHCAFSGLAKAAAGGTDAILLAIAFAVIIVLGLIPVKCAAFRRLPHVRPPLRGPPALA